jgi:hypothetical protein
MNSENKLPSSIYDNIAVPSLDKPIYDINEIRLPQHEVEEEVKVEHPVDRR